MRTRATRPGAVPGRALRRLLASAVLLAATATAPVAAGPTPLDQLPQPCDQLAVSPAFAQDRTVFCAGTAMQGFTPVGLAVLVSTDRGRTWRKAPALGLPYRPGDALKAITVSPRFAADRTVFVAVRNEGVFMSTDAGDTFTPLTLLGTPVLTPYVVAPAGDATARTMLLAVESVDRKPAVIDPVTRTVQPVVGAPAPATDIIVSPSWAADRAALAFTDTGNVGKNVVTAYRCSETFDCTTRAAAFPAGYRYQRAWFAGDFATSRTIFVALVPDIAHTTPKLWVSRDGGRTFARLAGAQAVVDRHRPHSAAADEPVVALATGRPGTDRVWMRLYGSSARSVPTAELYRSDDNGRSWTRVAYGRLGQPGPRGTMPDLRLPRRGEPARTLLAATPDDAVYLNGFTAGGWGLGCSTDGGRTWAYLCR